MNKFRVLQLLLVLTEELESKIYAFGARTDEQIQEIQAKIKLLGATEKRMKIQNFSNQSKI